MGEYQYYEFLALDKPLTDKPRAELRKQARADYPTMSGSVYRLASGMATSATTPEPWNG